MAAADRLAADHDAKRRIREIVCLMRSLFPVSRMVRCDGTRSVPATSAGATVAGTLRVPSAPVGKSRKTMTIGGSMSVESFPPEVAEKLRYYVYRLIDPRDGETFYVGKGKGDRVFAHARAEQRLLDGDETDNKLQRIRNIRLAGLEVGHVIHRHGMEEEIASVVEAALIDAYPGLTNAVASS
jgi:hypothetical protein